MASAGSKRLLLVDEFPEASVGGALRESSGLRFSHWRRFAVGGRLGSSWPSARKKEESEPTASLFGGAVVRLAATKAAAEFALNAVAPVLASGAPVWLYGARAEGAHTAVSTLLPRIKGLSGARVAASNAGFVVAFAVRNNVELGFGCVDDWATDTELILKDTRLPWRVFPGLFAGGLLDVMTATLLRALPSPPSRAKVLDFCSGAGTIAAALRVQTPDIRLTLLDADAVALEAARVNVPDAQYVLSDAWSNLPDGRTFDWIVSNPPVHCGLQPDFTVLSKLIDGALSRLRRGGIFWLVAQVYIPVGQLHEGIRSVFSDGRFTVWQLEAPAAGD
eukprot:TRINITY_DN27748_c0_g1_i1.p1 TRINITY_DN27748_c0_g1~~TRINITY_DN27748_c0_g1_i1.p1  ORF type:complete len:389 (-),score=82.31 TRINITY_DN27748_c0_g1_i1:194-1195(-)